MNLISTWAIALWLSLGLILWLSIFAYFLTDITGITGIDKANLNIKRVIFFTILCGPFAIIVLIIAVLIQVINKLDLPERGINWLTKEKAKI